jgi:hypothetical protein
MKQIISICIFFLAGQILHAQDTLPEKHLVFKATVIDTLNNRHKGFLATINDSVLYLTGTMRYLTFEATNLNSFQKYNYHEIDKVLILRRASVGRGMAIGGVSGLIVGAVIGATRPVDQTKFLWGYQEVGNGVVGALIGGAAGCLIGAAIGALSQKVFTIGGQKDKLKKMRETMTARLYNY